MSKRVLLSTIVCAVVLGVVLGYYRGVPDDFVNAPDLSIDYGYRCGDGSEFTVVPSEDMTTITIVPATSSDYLKEILLLRTAGDTYTSEGISFAAHDLTAELITASHGSTTCTSMNPPETTLFHRS